MYKKTSPIWTMPKEEMQKIIDSSFSFLEILRKLKIHSSGTCHKMIKDRILLDGLSIEKMKSNKRTGHPNGKKINLKDILVKESTYNRGHLKRRLLGEGILKNECSICCQKSVWNNKDLVMILDHINGVYNDNRIENLRLICPNCNSQTDTFGGRNNKKEKSCVDCGLLITRAIRCKKCYDKMRLRSLKNKCIDCGSTVTIKAKRCRQCSIVKREIKNRPSKEDLSNMMGVTSWVAIGKKYNVSDNTIRNWAREYGLVGAK